MREFVTSVYILQDQKVLLIFHKKLQKWLPPGGHLEPNEIPPEAAKREAFEETGLEIGLFFQENVWVEKWNATSFIRPYLCLLEEVPAYRDHPAHQHIDFIYVGYPLSGAIQENPQETNGIQWFSQLQIEALEDDKEIFSETKEVLKKILSEDWKSLKKCSFIETST